MLLEWKLNQYTSQDTTNICTKLNDVCHVHIAIGCTTCLHIYNVLCQHHFHENFVPRKRLFKLGQWRISILTWLISRRSWYHVGAAQSKSKRTQFGVCNGVQRFQKSQSWVRRKSLRKPSLGCHMHHTCSRSELLYFISMTSHLSNTYPSLNLGLRLWFYFLFRVNSYWQTTKQVWNKFETSFKKHDEIGGVNITSSCRSFG